MRKASIALAVVGLLLLAVPVLAQSNTIEIEVAGINRGDEGDIFRVASVDVDPGMVGWRCTGTAQTENNASEHPDNDFILTSGSSSTEILDWEAAAGKITNTSGTLVLGESITVDLRLGPDRVASGGVRIILTCSPPAATGNHNDHRGGNHNDDACGHTEHSDDSARRHHHDRTTTGRRR